MNFTIFGEPCSKSNSRIMIFNQGKPRSIKSVKAQNYARNFILQAQALKLPVMKGDVILHCNIYYASLRSDLDESLIMDCLQTSGILKNDRQIKEKHIFHHIDKKNPRAEIELFKMYPEIVSDKNL